MPICPGCGSELRTVKQEGGLFFLCGPCGGRAATIPQIQRAIGDNYVTALLHQINAATHMTSRKCPFCSLPMRVFQDRETGLILDACKGCGAVWFDSQEFEQAARGGKHSAKALPPGSGPRRPMVNDSDESPTVEALTSLARFLCLPF